MCGRFVLFRLARFTDLFPWIRAMDGGSGDDNDVSDLAVDDPVAKPRYNVAPRQDVAVVPNDGLQQVQRFNWGLVPWWAKDPAVGNKMINARAESLAGRPAFRKPLAKRRCLVLADGFYEWRKEPGSKLKTPMFIRLRNERPIAFAGLWERWRDRDSGRELKSCTIITTTPNELMRPIHDRMPAILPEERWREWIDVRERPVEEVLPLLGPYPAEEMEAYPVSRAVNRAANEGAELIAPALPATAEAGATDADASMTREGLAASRKPRRLVRSRAKPVANDEESLFG